LGREDCVACHVSDFQVEHAGSGFPLDCVTCHAVTTWGDANFDHDADFFPITRGAHKEEEWADCATCHTVPTDLSVFTCLVCHDHRQSKMDDKHEEEAGYVYESSSCLSCHPDGKS
jgi:hypothetical protein